MYALPRAVRAIIRVAPLMLLLAGCPDGGPTPIACDPACSEGFSCDTVTGTCQRLPAQDAAVPADLAMSAGCNPACAAPTPHCDAKKRCQVCLVSEHCPMGNICKTLVDGSTICAPGCENDTRCPMGQACCMGQCTAVQADARNCGACGNVCQGLNTVPVCVAGKCESGKCRDGFGDCDGKGENGCETSVRVDPSNCTACGKTCSFKNGLAACSNGCYLTACTFGYDDCNFDDVDGCETSVLSDAQNCGGCKQPCTSRANAQVACESAACLIKRCNVGWGNCDNNQVNGCEVDLNNNAANCGACGLACPQGRICSKGGCTCQNCLNAFPNASADCVNGQCVFKMCNPGFANCDGNQQNGCEADLNYDPKNCGMCNNTCPMNMPYCGQGQCGILWWESGVQVNVPAARLAGWTECYKDFYGDSGTQMAAIWQKCSKGRLMLACRQVNTQTLTTLAMGMRADVLFDTGQGNMPHDGNGVGWYYNASYSLGYAKQGDMLSRNSCDTAGTNPEQRLCWHSGGNAINGGWRCGAATGLNGDRNWERLIYQAD